MTQIGPRVEIEGMKSIVMEKLTAGQVLLKGMIVGMTKCANLNGLV